MDMETGVKQIENTLAQVHNEIHNVATVIESYKGKTYPRTYDGLVQRLEDRMDVSYNVSALISLMVLAKSGLEQLLRERSMFAMNSRIGGHIKTLNENIQSYRSISYGVGGELGALKNMIMVKTGDHQKV
jgi:hypothetical protein